ncbi:MAG TPA: LacI family transcriptional regulator [Firmicutes bacterium]|nr:LacI family transcriptional regulator [Bacillota bacterium]
MRVNMHDIAKAAHVSVSTVSRALRGHAGISEETRASIMKVASELGYFQYTDAKPKSATSTARHIIVCVPKAENLAAAHELILRGIREYTEYAGASLQIVGENYGDKKSERANLLMNRVLFITPKGYGSLIQHCNDLGITTAATLRTPDFFAPFHIDITVHPDEAVMASLIVTKLRGLGHKRIAFVGEERTTPMAKIRAAHLQKALLAAGLPVEPEWFILKVEKHCENIIALVRQPREERPSVLVCATDTVAIVLLKTLLDVGIRVPEDIAVVGIHNIPYTSFAKPSITTVDVHLTEIGYEAARQLLLYQLREPRRQVDITIPVKWVERGSTCTYHDNKEV